MVRDREVKRITSEVLCREFLSKQAGKAENTILVYKQTCRLHTDAQK